MEPNLGIQAWSESKFSSWLEKYLIIYAHGLQHTRLPCPSPPPRACSNSCPWSRWGHPVILSSVDASSKRNVFSVNWKRLENYQVDLWCACMCVCMLSCVWLFATPQTAAHQYKLNKQGDNVLTWLIPFPILNQSSVPGPVLTDASWHAYRFLRRQVKWSGKFISLRIFYSLSWSTWLKGLA